MDTADIHRNWVKENKQAILGCFCGGVHSQDGQASAVFMCGSSGAGKTEESKWLKSKYLITLKHTTEFVHIDDDRIKAMIPGYEGHNASDFRKAASYGVDVVLSHCYKNNFNFILDTTFSNYKRAQENIDRAIKRDRTIDIIYVYREPLKTWQFVKDREKIEGRAVPVDAFINSYFGAFETLEQVKKTYKLRIRLKIINKDINKAYKNQNSVNEYVKLKYKDRESLEKALQKMDNSV